MELLHEHIREVDTRTMTLMSDRQKRIMVALQKIWPSHHIRFCFTHIFANFKAKFPGSKLRNLCWAATRSYTKEEFDMNMDRIKRISEIAYKWLMDIPVEHWSAHAFDHRVKNEYVTITT